MNTALITGASSGIGEAFGRKLTSLGRNVFLVSRSEDKLISLCNELGRTKSVRVQYMAIDLTAADAPATLFSEIEKRGLTVDLLVNNAGFGALGDFAKLDLARQLNMIDLNIKALVDLTHRFLEPMRSRGQGAIINVASTAGFQPVPFMATYSATKAFVLNFSEALWEENRKFGVHVMTLCPGVTETNFFEASSMERPPMRVAQSPEDVVDTALRALARKRRLVVSGWTNLLMIEAERFVPRSLIVRAAGRSLRPDSGE
jgi:short-subunit dehydrogenase